jgi:hypothetical protein
VSGDVSETPSLDLLSNQQCIEIFDTYAIRYHDAIKLGPHFDYAIGARQLDVCADFTITRTITNEEYGRGDNLPTERGDRKLLKFMPAHDPVVIFGRKGKVYPIPEGEYGAGTWQITRRGRCTVEPTEHGHGFILTLGDVVYTIAKDGKITDQRDTFLIMLHK